MSEFIDREKSHRQYQSGILLWLRTLQRRKMPRVSDYGRDGCAGR
nr:MAG TPA: hypothetical protein [Caudoviricetes sp.]